MSPLISICIPAYKNEQYLKRLLDSIAAQAFKDFEVVITDDSDSESVKSLIQLYNKKFTIRYFKNDIALGMPANWNKAISVASGQWIKLMHDDDWFINSYSLQLFAEHTNQQNKIIVSAYVNCYEDDQVRNHKVLMSPSWKNKLLKNPNILFVTNLIGPPSAILIHRSVSEEYNEQLRWRVDIEYYIRVLKNIRTIKYIEQPLINIGVSSFQVTNSCINNPAVELPEGFFLLKKYGVLPLKNILIYDAWWRLLRNMNINDEKKLKQYVNDKWPVVILKIVKDLSLVNKTFLNIGIVSKTFMFLSYLKNVSSIKR